MTTRNAIEHWFGVVAVGLLLCVGGCAANVDDGQQEGVGAVEEATKTGSDEVIDIGCINTQDANQNTRYANLGGTDTFLFTVCATPPFPRIGFSAHAWHKSFAVVVTDPNGNAYGPDPQYSSSDTPVVVAPAIVGDYTATVTSKGNGSYVVGIVNDMFTP